jgi:hypothetical protein
VYLHSHSPPPIATVIGIPTYNTPDVYTVAFKDGSICEYTSDMLSAVPDKVMSTSSTLLPSWIKWGANATLFLTHMAKPRHGTLNISDDNLMFYPGKSKEGILLSDLGANCQTLLDTGQLFKGHAKFKSIYDARNRTSLLNCVLHHVSAHGLKSLVAPTSLKNHTSMYPADNLIWDEAYNEEYDGLVPLPTWEVVSEAHYCQLSKGKRALPNMAIATIKYDEHSKISFGGVGKLGLPYLVKRRYSCSCIITIGAKITDINGYL